MPPGVQLFCLVAKKVNIHRQCLLRCAPVKQYRPSPCINLHWREPVPIGERKAWVKTLIKIFCPGQPVTYCNCMKSVSGLKLLLMRQFQLLVTALGNFMNIIAIIAISFFFCPKLPDQVRIIGQQCLYIFIVHTNYVACKHIDQVIGGRHAPSSAGTPHYF